MQHRYVLLVCFFIVPHALVSSNFRPNKINGQSSDAIVNYLVENDFSRDTSTGYKLTLDWMTKDPALTDTLLSIPRDKKFLPFKAKLVIANHNIETFLLPSNDSEEISRFDDLSSKEKTALFRNPKKNILNTERTLYPEGQRLAFMPQPKEQRPEPLNQSDEFISITLSSSNESTLNESDSINPLISFSDESPVKLWSPIKEKHTPFNDSSYDNSQMNDNYLEQSTSSTNLHRILFLVKDTQEWLKERHEEWLKKMRRYDEFDSSTNENSKN